MKIFDKYANKLKALAKSATNSGNYEKAMAAISAYANLAYEWNQCYTDDEIENLVTKIADNLFLHDTKNYTGNDTTILFYDYFGLDIRGLAIIYAKALAQLNRKIIWVVPKHAFGKIPETLRVVKSGNVEVIYISHKTFVGHALHLAQLFEKYCPSKAFFYASPNPVSAATVFHHFAGKVERFQINLTDHAFWLGKNAFDICLEFREYGAGISQNRRGIQSSKTYIFPYYPWQNKDIAFQGFNFDTMDKKIIFSGGSLYKTIGGNDGFYRLIDKALEVYENTIFLYAGEGDTSKLDLLKNKWGARVQHITERKDLFQLMKHIDVYLNTYPMIGGLMTQYAAIAGKVPLTLKDIVIPCSEGILLNQADLNVEFSTIETLIAEMGRLLSDDSYYLARAEEMKKSVISEGEFKRNLDKLLRGQYVTCGMVPMPDDREFLKDYVSRFSMQTVENSIVQKKHLLLLFHFPCLFFRGILKKSVAKIQIRCAQSIL